MLKYLTLIERYYMQGKTEIVTYSVILNTTKNALEFRPSFGFYYKHIHDLQKVSDETLTIDVSSTDSIAPLKKLPESSVGFFWFRMHGLVQSMAASETLTIDVNNVYEIFDFLPRIMKDKGVIFLDSCSTASLQSGCNNMQFAFAKLTLEKPNIQIVAPSERCHVSYFSISKEGDFSFEMQGEGHSTKNISVVLNHETKAILSKTIASNTSLELVKEELKNSLCTYKACPFLDKYMATYGQNFQLIDLLISSINRIGRDSNRILEQVKDLIETYHASPNDLKGTVRLLCSWQNASPLSSAVHYKLTSVVRYLLEHGADPLYTLDGTCLLDYAKQRDANTKEYSLEDDIEKYLIAKRREKENDNANMFDILNDYVNSNQQSKDSRNPVTPFWSQKHAEVESNNSTMAFNFNG